MCPVFSVLNMVSRSSRFELVMLRRAKMNQGLIMSTIHAMSGGWVDRRSVPMGPNGRGLCRWCNLEVPPGRFTFCSAYCVHEWKLQSQPSYLRERVRRTKMLTAPEEASRASRQIHHLQN